MNRADAKILADRWLDTQNTDELLKDLVGLANDSFINWLYAHDYQIEGFSIDPKWATAHGAVSDRMDIQKEARNG